MKILFAYDGSPSAEAAIDDLRKAGLPTETQLLVVSVGDGNLTPPEHIGAIEADFNTASTTKLSEAHSLAEGAKRRIRSYFPQWTVDSEALWGVPGTILMETCAWWHPDLIVVGSHGHSRLTQVLLGSVSLELVHNAACSVRVARAGSSTAAGAPLRLVIGNDGSAQAEAVIDSVGKRNWPEKTEVEIVAVVRSLVPVPLGLEISTFSHEQAFNVIREADEHERVRLKKAAEDSASFLRLAGLNSTSTVIDGQPGAVIVGEAERSGADVIFVGARGSGPVERLLLGSVSTHVVTHAHCSVEVVRQVG